MKNTQNDLLNDSIITTIVVSINKKSSMKSSEFIQKAKKNGRQVVIPNHGSKELGKGLEQKLRREMGL